MESQTFQVSLYDPEKKDGYDIINVNFIAKHEMRGIDVGWSIGNNIYVSHEIFVKIQTPATFDEAISGLMVLNFDELCKQNNISHVPPVEFAAELLESGSEQQKAWMDYEEFHEWMNVKKMAIARLQKAWEETGYRRPYLN